MNVFEKFAGILLRPRETFSKLLRKEKSLANAVVFFALAVAIGLLSLLPARIEVIGASAVISILSLIVGATMAHYLGKLFFRIKAGYGSTLRIFLYWGAVMSIRGTVESLLWTSWLFLSQNWSLPIESFYPPFTAISILVGTYLLYVLAAGLSVTYDIPVLHAFFVGFASSVSVLYFSAWILPIIQGAVYP